MTIPTIFPREDEGGVTYIVKGIQPAYKAGGISVAIPASMFSTGGAFAKAGTDGSSVTATTTSVYVVSIFVDCNTIATGISLLNGGTAAGNVTVGIADYNGVVRAVSAATAQTGTNVYQNVPFTSTYQLYGPGIYYLLFQFSNATATFQTWGVGSFPSVVKTSATLSSSYTFTPPTTFATGCAAIASLY